MCSAVTLRLIPLSPSSLSRGPLLSAFFLFLLPLSRVCIYPFIFRTTVHPPSPSLLCFGVFVVSGGAPCRRCRSRSSLRCFLCVCRASRCGCSCPRCFRDCRVCCRASCRGCRDGGFRASRVCFSASRRSSRVSAANGRAFALRKTLHGSHSEKKYILWSIPIDMFLREPMHLPTR